VADIIRTTLGPKSMLKMLLDPTGGIVMTNDGNAILREVDVSHPGAKSMVELSRAQDEEVGDGTTSVIVIAGEMLHVAEPLLLRDFHPTVICSGYLRALDDALVVLRGMAFPIDLKNRAELCNLVRSSIGTKFISRFSDQMVELALDAVETVYSDSHGRIEIDIKRYAKVEKLPGGDIEHSRVLKGVMINKDITHPKMRRRIERPRVLLLDCTLEYKKGESATSVELTDESQWEALLKQEEDWVTAVCQDILAVKPDVVVTEKGVSDLAQHFLVKVRASRPNASRPNASRQNASGARGASREPLCRPVASRPASHARSCRALGVHMARPCSCARAPARTRAHTRSLFALPLRRPLPLSPPPRCRRAERRDRAAPHAQDGQQPHRARVRRDDRQPARGDQGERRRHGLRTL
jgi:T-complex protein 1 subunit gamma